MLVVGTRRRAWAPIVRGGGIAAVIAVVVCATSHRAEAGRKSSVSIDSSPQGAEIFIDDVESDSIGTTPLKTRLAPGTYTIILKKDGYDLEFRTFRVKRRGRNKLEASLERTPMGYVILRASKERADELAGAVVIVDGEERGEVPLELDLAAGPHEIAIEKSGFKTQELWIELDEGATERIAVDLASSGARPAAPKPAVDTDAENPEVEVSKPAGSAVARSSAAVVIGAGLEVGGRRFRYENAQTANLREYDAGAVPRLRILVDVYPLAFFMKGALARIGITGSYGRAAPLTSFVKSDGTPVTTTWQDFDVGVRYEHPVAGAASVGAGVSFGNQSFQFEGPLATETPGVNYKFVRLGVDGKWRAHKRVTGFVGADFKVVSALGEMDARFETADATAFGGRIGVLGHITSTFSARLEGTYSFYSHSYVPAADMEYVADGGTDEIFAGLVGVSYAY